MTTGSSASARRWAQQRRRSVIGVAPESLQRIVSEAERIKDLCVFHLGKMSPSWIDFMRRVELALEGDGPASRDEAKDGSEGDDEDDSVPPLPRQPVQQEPRQVLVGAGPGTYGSVVV
ncbi:hypothetical protein EC988_006454 [Linderina pennispora]|nr:hypothetical protein EC988_006454 [Linderina pennispora]